MLPNRRIRMNEGRLNMNDKPKKSMFDLSPSRRDVVKGATALAGAAAIGGIVPKASAADEDTLTLLTWPGHADAHVVGPFEEETGVKIVPKEYVGGEAMLSLLQQSPAGTYDVILTGNAYIEMMRDAGFIEKLDPTDYPIEDFWPEFQNFPTHWLDGDLYSVMVSYGFIGMAYNTNIFTAEDLRSYAALWSDKAAGKVGHFDWYLPSMGVLSIYNGNENPYDIDEAQFEKLKETLFSLRPQVAGFYAFAGLFGAMTGEEAWVVPGIGEWLTILMQKDGLPVDMTIPDEGGLQWTESLSIATGSKKQELAKKFIQYMSSPEGLVREATKPAYNASIPSIPGWEKLNADRPEDAVMLRHEFDKPNVIDDIRAGKINVRYLPKQQSVEDWNEAWTEYKNL